MFQRIFVPCDGSSASFQALDQALHIAQREGSTVTVLCIIDARVLDEPEIYLPIDDEIRVSTEVVSQPMATLTYQAWVRQVALRAEERGRLAGVEVHTETVTGLPYREIIARCPEYDLLVMGIWDLASHYPGPFLAGSTYWRVVTHTRLPILCVRGQSRDIRRILAAYDNSREAVDALQLAVTWCQAWGLQLVVLTVQPDGDLAQTLLRRARARARPLNPALLTRDGDPAEAIQTVARDYECDLIALGVHGERHLLERLEGGVVNTILRTSTLPVLLSH